MALHSVHTAGVTGSIPVAPTNQINGLGELSEIFGQLHPRKHPRKAFARAEVVHA